jgi:hypothetical protein
MEIAHAQIQQEGKGEDAYLVRRLDGKGMVKLLAVADGLSLSGGKAAAHWVINCLRRLTEVDSPRSIYKALKRELGRSRQVKQSETTLTCGILRQVIYGDDNFLRFEYFAIGDSPIWKVILGDSKYPFQRIMVHGPPYPAETARVYSTLRLDKKDITGSIAFGVTELALGEVLVVCTDGIPEREVFVRDFVSRVDEDSGKAGLCHWLFQQRKYSDRKLKRVLESYDKQGILFDDATIITARLEPPPINRAESIVPVMAEAGSAPTLQNFQSGVSVPGLADDRSSLSNGTDLQSDLLSHSAFQTSNVTAQPSSDELPMKTEAIDTVHTETTASPPTDGEKETPNQNE